MITTDGSYTVSGFRTDRYKVGFSNSGYVMRYYSHAVSSADATPVQVTAPTTISGIDCHYAGGSISGRVTDGSGSSLTNSGIIAYNEYDEMIGYGTTDQNGAYLLRGFPDGAYKIYFDGSTAGYVGTYYNNKSDMAEADPVTISGSAEKTGINAVLNRGGEYLWNSYRQ